MYLVNEISVINQTIANDIIAFKQICMTLFTIVLRGPLDTLDLQDFNRYTNNV